jgi:DNA primase
MHISDEAKEEVKKKVRIRDLVARYADVEVPRKGGFKVHCPFHDDSTPSMHIYPEGPGGVGGFHCYGCHEGGDPIAWVKGVEGLSFPEAVRWLIEEFSLNVHLGEMDENRKKKMEKRKKLKGAVNRATEFYHQTLKQQDVDGAEEAMRYLTEERGLEEETIDSFKIGFAPWGYEAWPKSSSRKVGPQTLVEAGIAWLNDEGKPIDRFTNRIVFPIRERVGTPIGFAGRTVPGVKKQKAKYINSPGTPIYSKGDVFYGMKNANWRRDEVIIVEGYTDVVGMWQIGVENVMAVCGTSFTEAQAETLAKDFDRALFVMDGDESGRESAGKAVRKTLPLDITAEVCLLPDGKDPDDMAQDVGEKGEGAQEAVNMLRRHQMGMIEFAIEESRRKGEDKTPEGRVRVQQEIANLIGSIPGENLRREYIKDASRQLRVPGDKMYEMVQESRGKSAKAEKKEEYRGIVKLSSGAAHGEVTEGEKEKPRERRIESEDGKSSQAESDGTKGKGKQKRSEEEALEETWEKVLGGGREATQIAERTAREAAKHLPEQRGKIEKLVFASALKVGREGIEFTRRLMDSGKLRDETVSRIFPPAWRKAKGRGEEVRKETLPYQIREKVDVVREEVKGVVSDLGLEADDLQKHPNGVLRGAAVEIARLEITEKKKMVQEELEQTIEVSTLKERMREEKEIEREEAALNKLLRGEAEKGSSALTNDSD